MVRGQVGRLRGRAEVGHDRGEALRVVVMRHVAGAGEDLQPAAGHRLVRGLAVLGRDDRVLLAPDDQRGQDGRQVQAVVGAHALAAGVDHRAHGVQEGLAGAAGLQRGEPGAEHREVALGRDPAQTQRRAQSGPEAARREHGQHPVGARAAPRRAAAGGPRGRARRWRRARAAHSAPGTGRRTASRCRRRASARRRSRGRGRAPTAGRGRRWRARPASSPRAAWPSARARAGRARRS